MAHATPCLLGRSSAELAEAAISLGEKPYRGKQLAHQLYRAQNLEFADMTNLPAAFRTRLAENFRVHPLTISRHIRSEDQVDKLLVHGGDNNVFECVHLPYAERISCCVSTQVGCPMGCTFCATGLGGFDRNLSVAEIIGQYLLLQKLAPKRIGHVVFMGMGEPLLNLDAVTQSIEILCSEIGLSQRHITVSTVGIVPQILQLAEKRLQIHLAVSLHSPFDEVRSQLMPVNKRWPVATVMEAMREYGRKTGRKITIEYLLIRGINDTSDQADALAQLVRGIPSVINLIPYNWVDTSRGYERPTRERIQRFRSVLEGRGANVTERVERGHDIAAACGQLAGEHEGKFAKRPLLRQVQESP